ncbi:MAG: SPOR domain-containing protein [Planctomycetota bacterium]|jgi:hypothetical protein
MPFPSPPSFARGVAAAAACLLLLAVGGCSTTTDRVPSTLDRAESAYRRGDFDTAARLAASLEGASSGRTGEEAAYVHGLAAARLGRAEDARNALERAAGSSDSDLADRARRSLAALDGGGTSTSVAAEAVPTGGGFTVQAGAFSSESAARARAAELDSAARAAGYGSAVVRRISSRRGPLWAVQIGRFGDRRQAGLARDRLGHPEWAIEAVGSR